MGFHSFFSKMFTRRGAPASTGEDFIPRTIEEMEFLLEKATAEFATIGPGGIPTIEDWVGEDADPDRFIAAYKKMRHDPAVKAALLSLLFEVASLDLRVQPSDPDDPRAKEIAEFIQHALESVEGGVPRGMLIKIMEPALMYQFSISEIIYKIEARGKWKGKWVLRALKSKDTSEKAWGFRLDPFRNIVTFLHTSPYGNREYHPDKFVHYTFMPMFESPRGLSHLRAAYRAWYVKLAVTRSWAFHAQTNGILPVAKYRDKKHKADLEIQLAALNSRRWLAIPEEVQLDIVKLSDSASDQSFKDIIERLDKQIFLSIRFAVLQALEGDKTGARSMGEVHKSTSQLPSWFLSVDVAETILDQIVENLVKFNFGEEAELPRVALEAPVEEDMQAKAQTLLTLVTAGLPVSAQQVSETFGWDMPKDEADALKPPAPATESSPFDFSGHDEEEEDEITRASRSASLAAANGESWSNEFLTYYSRARKGRS